MSATVSKEVSSYVIEGGVPVKVIRLRFFQPIINKLIKIDLSKLYEQTVRENKDKFYKIVDENTELSWLPQKTDIQLL